MAELEIKCITVSECYTNCYICCNKETKEGFVVDPGDDSLKIRNYINSMDIKLTAILLTHGHFDHVGAVKELKEKYNVKVYASEMEKETLEDSRRNLTSFFGAPFTLEADIYVKDEELLEIAGIKMKFILTPGHTPGSGCYYVEDNGILFSGDTLFQASRGRTDFPGGSEKQIIYSIIDKLLVLPGDTMVLPGHMDSTTIDEEKAYYRL